jgi:hypothetical protein
LSPKYLDQPPTQGAKLPTGSPFTHEFWSPERPADLLHSLVVDCSAGFARCGHQIESHGAADLTLARRYVPPAAYSVPLAVAGLLFVLAVVGSQPNAAGTVAGIMVLLAIGLSAVIRGTERVTITLREFDGGTQGLISGQATPALQSYLLKVSGASTERTGSTPAKS